MSETPETPTDAAGEPDAPREDLPPHERFQETLSRALEAMALRLSPTSEDHLKCLFEMLAEANMRMSLVADAAPEVVAVKHVADSLLMLTTEVLEDLEVRYAVDLGTGAGFPGLVLGIARPDIHWLLIESTGKKARFLEEVIFSLGLDNVSISTSRAEALAHNAVKREEYDLVVCRGLAHCAVICELGLPFLKRGGRLVAYKGPDGEREAAEAARAAELCGGEIRPVLHATLPIENHQRTFICWDKGRSTPGEYPRREGVPQKRPLM